VEKICKTSIEYLDEHHPCSGRQEQQFCKSGNDF
jgi:hypothetical protein